MIIYPISLRIVIMINHLGKTFRSAAGFAAVQMSSYADIVHLGFCFESPMITSPSRFVNRDYTYNTSRKNVHTLSLFASKSKFAQSPIATEQTKANTACVYIRAFIGI